MLPGAVPPKASHPVEEQEDECANSFHIVFVEFFSLYYFWIARSRCNIYPVRTVSLILFRHLHRRRAASRTGEARERAPCSDDRSD